MKKQLVTAFALSALLTTGTQSIVSANSFGVMETKFSKIVSYRDSEGNFLASKCISAKKGETVTVTLPNIKGFIKPVESADIYFDNGDTVVYTYKSEDGGSDNLQKPDITLPSAPSLVPENPTPITPVVPPVSELATFKVYSELRDWSGNLLVAQWNPVTLTGITGEKVNFKAPLLETGYVLSEAPTQTEFYFGKDTEAKYVYKLRYGNITQMLVRRINFVDENGVVLKQVRLDGYTFRGTEDYALNKYIWETKSTTLAQVDAPEIAGYTAIDSGIPAQAYSPVDGTLDSQVHDYTLHYKKN